MREKSRLRFLIIAAASFFILGATFVLSLPLENPTKFLLLTLIALFLGSLFDYQKGFLLFLFLRPIIDLATTKGIFYLENFNINAIYGFFMIVFSLIIIFDHRREMKKTPYLTVFWAAFLLWSIISLFYSFNILESFKELSRYLSIFFNFLAASLLFKDNDDLSRLIKTIIWSAFIPSIIATVQYFDESGLIEDQINRVYGSMVHPNMLAFFLTLPIILAIFIFLNIRKQRVEAYVYLLLAAFYSSILFLTYTRGAYVVLLLMLFLVGFFHFRRFLLFSLTALLLIYAFYGPVRDRFNTIINYGESDSISWRLDLYRDSISYAAKKPLIGYGIGLAEKVIDRYRDFRLGSSKPHNDFILLALEGGLIGLGLYLLLIFVLASSLWRAYRHEKLPRLRMLNLFLLIFLFSTKLMSAGDNVISDTALEWEFWALIGALPHLERLKS